MKTALLISLASLIATIAVPSAARAQTVSPVMVVDANGKAFGPVTSAGAIDQLVITLYTAGNARAFVTFGGSVVPALLNLQTTGLLYYASDDCSGSPLVTVQRAGVPPSTFLVTPKHADLYMAYDMTPQTITMHSVKAGPGCRRESPETVTGYPAAAPIDLYQLFAPPFSIR